MNSEADPGATRLARRFPRVPAQVPVMLFAHGVVDRGTALNVSEGGVCVKAERDLPLGGSLAVRGELETASFAATVEVVHGSSLQGYGLKFVEIADPSIACIRRFVSARGTGMPTPMPGALAVPPPLPIEALTRNARPGSPLPAAAFIQRDLPPPGAHPVVARLVQPGELARAEVWARTKGLPLEEAVIAMGLVSERELLSALAYEYGVQYLTSPSVAKLAVVNNLLDDVPVVLAERYELVPFRLKDETLWVLASAPLSAAVVADLQVLTGAQRVTWVLGRYTAVRAALRRHYFSDIAAFEKIPAATKPEPRPQGASKRELTREAVVVVPPDLLAAEQEVQRLHATQSFFWSLAKVPNRDALATRVLDFLLEQLSADLATFFVRDADGSLSLVRWRTPAAEPPADLSVALSTATQIVASGNPLSINTESRPGRPGLAVIGAPISILGEARGAICVEAQRSLAFSTSDLRFLGDVGAHTGFVIQTVLSRAN